MTMMTASSLLLVSENGTALFSISPGTPRRTGEKARASIPSTTKMLTTTALACIIAMGATPRDQSNTNNNFPRSEAEYRGRASAPGAATIARFESPTALVVAGAAAGLTSSQPGSTSGSGVPTVARSVPASIIASCYPASCLSGMKSAAGAYSSRRERANVDSSAPVTRGSTRSVAVRTTSTISLTVATSKAAEADRTESHQPHLVMR